MHPLVDIVRKGVPVLEASTNYCVEKDRALLTVSGWAIDAQSGDTAGGLAVVINGQPHVAVYGLRRKDVARSLGNRKLVASRFRCHVPVKDVPPGRHPLTLTIQTRDHQAIYDVSGELEVIPAQGYVVKACDPSPDGLPGVHTQ